VDRRPALYLEVGSGYSTRFARHALGSTGRIVSIDPSPRDDVDPLCDEVIRRRLEDTDLAAFSQLKAGDVLVVDGTHTAFMNSDSVVVFLEVLPRLPPGVLVCVDDIFLPWDYPPAWAGRWYGEQYLLAQLLLCGAPGWEVVFPAWHVTHSPDAGRLEPVWDQLTVPPAGKVAKSFWMQRV